MADDTALDQDFTCPRCHVALQRVRSGYGMFWSCPKCGGRAVGVELLRRTFTPESINPLWLHAIRGEGTPGARCPSCHRPMTEVSLSDQAGVRVDVCRICHFVWFDMYEVNNLAPRPLPEEKKKSIQLEAKDLPETAWQKIAHVLTTPVDPMTGFIRPRIVIDD